MTAFISLYMKACSSSKSLLLGEVAYLKEKYATNTASEKMPNTILKPRLPFIWASCCI